MSEEELKKARRVSILKGSDTEITSFTGMEGELTYNRLTKTIHVHDGVEVGGSALARADHTHDNIPNIPMSTASDAGKILQATNSPGTYTLVDPTTLTFSTTIDIVTGFGVFGKKLAKTITNTDARTLLGIVDAPDPTATFGTVGKQLVAAETKNDVLMIIDLASSLAGKRVIWIPGLAFFDPSQRQQSTWDDTLVAGSKFSGLTLDPTIEQSVAFDLILPTSWDTKSFSVDVLWVSKTTAAGFVSLKFQVIGYASTGSSILFTSGSPKKESVSTTAFGITKTSFDITVDDQNTTPWTDSAIIRLLITRAGDDVDDTYSNDIMIRGSSITYSAKQLSE